MELLFVILIGLVIIPILLLVEGLNFIRKKRKVSIGVLFIILGIIILLFVFSNYIILIQNNI